MIFLYHRVVADDAPEARCWSRQVVRLRTFRNHLAWLAHRFRIVSLGEYLATRRPWVRRLAALTFDDGFWSTFRLVRTQLEKRGVPATVFLPTAHFDSGELHWFAYLDALCFEGAWPQIECGGIQYALTSDRERRNTRRALHQLAAQSARPLDFTQQLNQRYRIDGGLHTEYRAMNADEVRAAARSDFVEFGCHSVTHPYLARLSARDQRDEIVRSGEMLERASGRPRSYFAYPSGAYNDESIAAVKAAGFAAALACVPNRVRVDPRFELARIGIYAHSFLKLAAKSFGAAHILRALNIPAG